MTRSRNTRVIRGLIAIVISGIYLINPTGGLIEIVPDILPFVGNIDEAAATALLLYGLRELRGESVVKTIP